MPNVKVATRLREIYEIPPGALSINDADTVDSVVAALEDKFPGIKGDLLVDDGAVRPDVVIYLDGQPIEPTNTSASVTGVGTIRIIQAMAGG
ncbi:MAG: MoaD/ThiS family protein [Rhodobacter sp.]|nr:MoaD/ThiS family protein [Rhodobacter sp.]